MSANKITRYGCAFAAFCLFLGIPVAFIIATGVIEFLKFVVSLFS